METFTEGVSEFLLDVVKKQIKREKEEEREKNLM